MISVICVSNKKEVYETYLKPSLTRQENCEFEFFLMENQDNRYRSAVEAFQIAAAKAKGEYLLFVHQDMELRDPLFLSKVEIYCKGHPGLGIAGVAGARGTSIISNITHAMPEVRVSEAVMDEAQEVDSLDECLFLIPADLMKAHPFDEKVCDHWHLYAVEYCYQMKELHRKVIVLPFAAYHASYGDFMNDGYYDTLRKVARKYHKKYARIHTTLRSWSTNPVLLCLNILYLKLKKAGKHS